MKYPLLKSLLALGTLVLACSCSDDKPSLSSNNSGEVVSVIPCEDAWYLPSMGYVILQDWRLLDFAGNHIGNVVTVPPTSVVIVKGLDGKNLIDQLDLKDTNIVKLLQGNATTCNVKPNVPQPSPTISACLDAKYLGTDKHYLIYDDLTVSDETGKLLGKIVPNSANPILTDLVDFNGTTIIPQIDYATLPTIKGNGVFYKVVANPAYHLKDATGDYIIYETSVVTNPSGTPVGLIDFATGTIFGPDNVTPITRANVATLPVLTKDNKCVIYEVPDVPSSSSVVTPPKSSSSAGSPTPKSSATVKSSSSVVKSSSSAVQSSSSKAPTGGCPKINVKGGAKGTGWATRYWDCCMPSCAWNENSGGNPTKTCDSRGKNVIGNGSGSVCSGGAGATCTSQIPFTVDGCDEYGFAFAAVPASNGGQCGKCFQLTFTGTGKYSNDANIKKLKGKKLIIMATNIGGDVQQGQFDIMIPGGGVGMFNGCSGMGWGAQGQQYGGLLSDCETETNYKAGQYASCLTKKCNSSFSNDAEAKKGCLFLAEWMGAAGNPNHEYVEVECPDVLKSRY